MMPWELLVQPFLESPDLRRALVASCALALAAGPIGVFLILQRLSLVGDAMSHAILPGVAVGFLYAGLSITAMTIGGFVAGVVVALVAGGIARLTPQHEDASFAALYLVSLGLGVLLVAIKGSDADLLHMLFGSVLELTRSALLLVAGISSVTLMVLAALYRVLLLDCLDPAFLRRQGRAGHWGHAIFLVLLALNLVAGYQVLGTLLVVGIMMLPAAGASFWLNSIAGRLVLASLIGMAACWLGLLISWHAGLPAAPAMILTAGVFYGASVLAGTRGSLMRRMYSMRREKRQLLELTRS